MKEFSGIPVSPGIVKGKAFLYLDDSQNVPKYEIRQEDMVREFERFIEATEKAAAEVLHLKKSTKGEIHEQQSRFLDAHLLMLNDPVFSDQVKDNLEKYKQNVEWIILKTVGDLVDSLSSSQDMYMRERAIDFHDVSQRVLNHLMYRERISLKNIPADSILICHTLMPSETISMDRRKVKGIALEVGGKTSHTAILARAFEIPAVLGISGLTDYVNNGDTVIIDGYQGKVIFKPDEETAAQYETIYLSWQKREVKLMTMNKLPAETKDGKHILLKANIEVPEETESVLSHGADGVGLYRSEFLYMQSSGAQSEESQFEAYSEVLKAMRGKPVTIRTLDVGGDKYVPGLLLREEKNPILGWRAIRYCLSELPLFKVQLKSLLRASVFGDLRIMFPMISGIEELDQALRILDEVKEDCAREGHKFNEQIPIGIMIEVPSAALTSDILATRVDFFSIGTNDLIQYTIAVDRGNEKIAYLYEPFHPAVLRLIKNVISNAHEVGIPVTMCGEMAGDPYASVVLLGLGLDIFSMSAFGIPEIKQIIRSVKLSHAEELVGAILEMRSSVEIDRYIKDWMNERFELTKFT
ncbi:MAG: phosphoenolpyruvate--protein phosphotransferase [Spirochaetales bacterium]|nr:phosphoenolpyruvate--protein phosphotransferase [Spirochaetales bacterium]